MQYRLRIQNSLLTLIGLCLTTVVLAPGASWAQERDEESDETGFASTNVNVAKAITDANGNVVLQSFVDGALLAPGKQGEGTIPAEGPGTRLMWYPAKAAFRAGQINGNYEKVWNKPNIGHGSVAIGTDTKASGFGSVAFGSHTIASRPGTVAMGDGTEASAIDATALGSGTIASNTWATALGSGTTASGSAATAMGEKTTASGSAATAMGKRTAASGWRSLAMGYRTKATGKLATAMGSMTTASGRAATAMSKLTKAATGRSLSIGKCNDANRAADGTLFVVGNGGSEILESNCSSRSDAFKVTDDGEAFADAHKTVSDRRLKTNIEPLSEDILNELSEIRPVRFHFKNERTHPSGEQIGVVAQDVREVFPTLVSKGAGGYLSLAYPKLTAVLLKGLQEQQAGDHEQQTQIEALKAQNKALEKRLSKLESHVHGGSVLAGLPGSTFLLGLLLGGLFGVGLLWHIREATSS